MTRHSRAPVELAFLTSAATRRTTCVVLFLFLSLSAHLDVALGQGVDERHPDRVFGLFAEQDLEAVAASYTQRLSSAGMPMDPSLRRTLDLRLDLPSGRPRLSQEQPPVPDGGGGSRFGGPLVWAMVIIAATTVGFVYIGIRLSPGVSAPPPEG